MAGLTIPRAAAALCALFAAGAALGGTPPHLGAAGRGDYAAYLEAHGHRAFAIAPGGAWGWKADAASPDEASEAALSICGEGTAQKCVLYSVDGKPVFDSRGWSRLWGPYVDAASAKRAAAGNKPGQRFPDLAFGAADSRKLSVSGLRGKVVVLHFWGSWCGPCRREMPDLQELYASLKNRGDIAFALLQVREDFATSQRWARAQKLHLPLHDSGASVGDPALRTADGGRIGDREIATSFPTTYVLDKRGIVIFSHVGPVADWSEYRNFLLDAAQRSGR